MLHFIAVVLCSPCMKLGIWELIVSAYHDAPECCHWSGLKVVEFNSYSWLQIRHRGIHSCGFWSFGCRPERCHPSSGLFYCLPQAAKGRAGPINIRRRQLQRIPQSLQWRLSSALAFKPFRTCQTTSIPIQKHRRPKAYTVETSPWHPPWSSARQCRTAFPPSLAHGRISHQGLSPVCLPQSQSS